jgi:tetratricopeptide (TPR) repeat protein
MAEARLPRTSPEGLLQRLNAALAEHKHRDVLEILAFTTVMYEDERSDESEASTVLAELFQAVGFLLRSVDQNQEAKRFLERSIKMRRQLVSDQDDHSLMWALEELLKISKEDGDVASESQLLEDLNRARTKRLEYVEDILPSLIQTEQWDTARSAAEEILDINSSLQPQDKSHIAAALNNLAFIEKRLGNLEAAERHYSEAIDLWRALNSNTLQSDLASGLNNLAQLHFMRGDIATAESLLREAVHILRQACGADTADFASIVSALVAYVHKTPPDQNTLRLAQANEMFSRVHLLARVSSELALVLDRQQRDVETHALHSLAIDLFRRLLGENHPDTLLAIERLAGTIEVNDPGGAEALIQDAVHSLATATMKFSGGLQPLASLEPVFAALTSGTALPTRTEGPENIKSLLNRASDTVLIFCF